RRQHGRQDPSGKLVLGWVGRFTDIKDPQMFAELAFSLKSAGLPARFVMVGDGPLRPAVQERILSLGLSSDFTLTGWQRDMARIYSDLDLLVCTSRNEGTPVTIIEGMATGCPFVAPRVGGLVDLAAGNAASHEGFDTYSNGVLVCKREIDCFSRAILALAADSALRTRMGVLGHQFVLSNFGQERLIREMEHLYARFVAAERPLLHSLDDLRTKS